MFSYGEPTEKAELTLTTGLFPAKTARTLPHHRSLHQLRPHPPVASSATVVASGAAGSSLEPGDDRVGMCTEFDNDQSDRFGSNEVCMRSVESVDIDACVQPWVIMAPSNSLHVDQRMVKEGQTPHSSHSPSHRSISLAPPIYHL